MDDDIIIISSDGIIIRIQASSVRICSRPSKGVTVMKVKGDSKVVTIARAPGGGGEEGGEVERSVGEDESSDDIAENDSQDNLNEGEAVEKSKE